MTIHKALILPEILDSIFVLLLPSPLEKSEHKIKSDLHDLQSCACVCQIWNAIATRRLWYNPCYLRSDNLTYLLSRIDDPSRRKFYAAHINKASLFTFNPALDRDVLSPPPSPCSSSSDSRNSSPFSARSTSPSRAGFIIDNNAITSSILSDLEFPKLHSVTIIAGYHASSLPKIKSESVKEVIIDTRHYLYNGIFVNRAEVDCIVKQVPTCFPNLETVIFNRRGDVSRTAIENLSERLPRLRILDDTQMAVRG